jgi:hypothetical protein
MGWGGRFRVTGWAARLWPTLGALAAAVMAAPAALAEEAQDWQLGMQPGVTPVRDHIDFLHDDILLPISAASVEQLERVDPGLDHTPHQRDADETPGQHELDAVAAA